MSLTVEEISKKYKIVFSDKDLTYSDKIIEIFNLNKIDNEKYYDLEDPIILNLLGLYYRNVHKDYIQMNKYLTMAIDLNNADAMFNLGFYYHWIDKKNNNFVKKYYEMAIERGHVEAMNNYGFYYQYTEVNPTLMKKYYEDAIEKCSTNAMVNLAIYYELNEDYDKMKEYYLMAIQMNNTDAMYGMAEYYFETEQDYDKMKEYYEMAVSLGNSDSMYALGNFYEVIEQNYDQMKKYYEMAITTDKHSEAMTHLGNYYRDVEKNFDEMKKYYLMAISNGYSIAMTKLANYYRDIEKDNTSAIYYYKMAKGYEDADAYFNYGYFLEITNGMNYGIVKNYLGAIDRGHIKAIYYLAKYFDRKNDKFNADRFYNIAAKKGYTESEYQRDQAILREKCFLQNNIQEKTIFQKVVGSFA